MRTSIRSITRFATLLVAALSGGLAGGSFAAIAVKLLFDLRESTAVLYIGMPVAIAFVLLIWPKLPAILGTKD